MNKLPDNTQHQGCAERKLKVTALRSSYLPRLMQDDQEMFVVNPALGKRD